MAKRRSSVIFTSLFRRLSSPFASDCFSPSAASPSIPSAFFSSFKSLGVTSVLVDRSTYSCRNDHGTHTGHGRKPAEVRIIRRPPHSLHSFVDRYTLLPSAAVVVVVVVVVVDVDDEDGSDEDAAESDPIGRLSRSRSRPRSRSSPVLLLFPVPGRLRRSNRPPTTTCG